MKSRETTKSGTYFIGGEIELAVTAWYHDGELQEVEACPVYRNHKKIITGTGFDILNEIPEHHVKVGSDYILLRDHIIEESDLQDD